MKKSIIFLICLSFIKFSSGQEETKPGHLLPSVDVRLLDGSTFNTSKISNDGKPVVLCFWALWCKPCIKEMTTFSEVYADWQKETGVKLYAVSIDDSRSTARVKPFVDSKAWEFEVLLDPNGDFKRALNVNLIPHTIVLNGKGEMVWQHTSFAEGSELELINVIRSVAKEESPE